jgi:hypothetical protein
MTGCQSLCDVRLLALAREQAAARDEVQRLEQWGRFLLEDEPRLRVESEGLDRWLDLNA